MKKLIFAIITLCTLLSSSVLVPPPAYAAVADCKKDFLGLPVWYEYLEVEVRGDGCVVTGPSTDGRLDFTAVATRVSLAILDILLRIAGMVAFGFIIYSGFKFVLSRGNSDQEKQARETAINALIGMVIAMFAVGLVTFVGRQLLL